VRSKAEITYAPRPDASPERELDTLAAVYHFLLFGCSNEKKAISVPTQKEVDNESDKPSTPG